MHGAGADTILARQTIADKVKGIAVITIFIYIRTLSLMFCMTSVETQGGWGGHH